MGMSSSIPTWLHYQHKSHLDLIDGFTYEQVRRQIITDKGAIFKNGVEKILLQQLRSIY